jgi:hypothetical protein
MNCTITKVQIVKRNALAVVQVPAKAKLQDAVSKVKNPVQVLR